MKLYYCEECNTFAPKRKNVKHKNDHNPTILSEIVKPIDGDMVPILVELNNLGFKTKWSCIGHLRYNYTDAYILFDKEYSIVERAAVLAGLNPETQSKAIWQDENGKLYVGYSMGKEHSNCIKLNEKVTVVRYHKYLTINDIEEINLDSIRRHRDILSKFINMVEYLKRDAEARESLVERTNL